MSESRPDYGSLQFQFGNLWKNVSIYEKGVVIDCPWEFLRFTKLWVKFAPKSWDISTKSFSYRELGSIQYKIIHWGAAGVHSYSEIHLVFKLRKSKLLSRIKCSGNKSM